MCYSNIIKSVNKIIVLSTIEDYVITKIRLVIL